MIYSHSWLAINHEVLSLNQISIYVPLRIVEKNYSSVIIGVEVLYLSNGIDTDDASHVGSSIHEPPRSGTDEISNCTTARVYWTVRIKRSKSLSSKLIPFLVFLLLT